MALWYHQNSLSSLASPATLLHPQQSTSPSRPITICMRVRPRAMRWRSDTWGRSIRATGCIHYSSPLTTIWCALRATTFRIQCSTIACQPLVLLAIGPARHAALPPKTQLLPVKATANHAIAADSTTSFQHNHQAPATASQASRQML